MVGVEYEEDLAELSAALLGRAGYTTVTVRQGDGTFGVPEAARSIAHGERRRRRHQPSLDLTAGG